MRCHVCMLMHAHLEVLVVILCCLNPASSSCLGSYTIVMVTYFNQGLGRSQKNAVACSSQVQRIKLSSTHQSKVLGYHFLQMFWVCVHRTASVLENRQGRCGHSTMRRADICSTHPPCILHELTHEYTYAAYATHTVTLQTADHPARHMPHAHSPSNCQPRSMSQAAGTWRWCRDGKLAGALLLAMPPSAAGAPLSTAPPAGNLLSDTPCKHVFAVSTTA